MYARTFAQSYCRTLLRDPKASKNSHTEPLPFLCVCMCSDVFVCVCRVVSPQKVAIDSLLRDCARTGFAVASNEGLRDFWLFVL